MNHNTTNWQRIQVQHQRFGFKLGISIVAIKGYGANATINFALTRANNTTRRMLRAEILRRLNAAQPTQSQESHGNHTDSVRADRATASSST